MPSFVPIVPLEDLEAAADLIRPSIALYIGGMGAKSMNFHANHFARLGYEAEVAKIQELYLSGRKAEATAAVPTALVEDIALIGSPAKIKRRTPTVGVDGDHEPDHPGAAPAAADRGRRAVLTGAS